ncbi:hypothetical protein DFJ74DRAFT_702091 [Hyaloraphidium curvatum]|nr:hypothetical protein DFJ74DRAFT_702091 [Hyaloraphidium curvatum]
MDTSSSSSSSSDERPDRPRKEKKDKKDKKAGKKKDRGASLVVLVRHGEKPVPKAADVDGVLSPVGQVRARFLAERFFARPAGGRPTFARLADPAGGAAADVAISHVFATRPDRAKKKRLRMELTVRPAAEALGLPVNLDYDADDAEACADHIRSLGAKKKKDKEGKEKEGKEKEGKAGKEPKPRAVLACFPHEHLPVLARSLLLKGINAAGGDPKWRSASPRWDDDDYSTVWIVRPGGNLESYDMDNPPRSGAAAAVEWEKGDFFEWYARLDMRKRAGSPAVPPAAAGGPSGKEGGPELKVPKKG